jgi:UDP-glucose:(heptosyl)LPS alpha-1,3-glucosyltransferase
MYLSEQEKNKYIKVYGTQESRFHALPPGIDQKRIRQALTSDAPRLLRQSLGIPEKSKVLLAIGSDFVRKGVDRTIRAIAALPELEKMRIHLVVIGQGKPRTLQRLTTKYGISGQLHIMGGTDQVPVYLAGADFLVHPAISENTGNVILEAMVAGLPVLATDTCGYALHIKQADAGRLVAGDPFRQEEMNATLSEMLVSGKEDFWQDNALRYAKNTDLYSRPQVAVKIMEQLAEKK